MKGIAILGSTGSIGTNTLRVVERLDDRFAVVGLGAGSKIEELAEHPVFSMADAIEVFNGGCIDHENRLAEEVARALGKPTTGGSDAHMPIEVGRYATVFEKDLASEEEMLGELRAGRFQAARRVDRGQYEVLEQEVASS